MSDFSGFDDTQSAATAPGDLPLEEVLRRLATLRTSFRHENTIYPQDPGTSQAVSVTALSGSAIGIESARIVYTTDGSEPLEHSAAIPMSGSAARWVPLGEFLREWTGTIPPQPEGTTVRYKIIGSTPEGEPRFAQDGQGFWYRYPPHLGVTTFAYYVSDKPSAPEWLRDAVIYQIFVDRFRSRSGRFAAHHDLQAKHGGDLLGIVDALPYLRDLGINCLWLSPIGPAPSYHRYDTTDLFGIDPVCGTTDDLKTLTSQAREHGMRVLLDFVPSHLSARHPAFVSAVENRNAESADWFVFYDWPSKYRTFLELSSSLVSINTNSASARSHLIESAKHWVDCGVAGFRLDHAIGHGMDFWTEFRAAFDSSTDEIVTIGEATDTGDALKRYQGKLSSILDFPLARALRLTFATGAWSLREFDGFLRNYETYMGSAPARVTFLDNHDMDRFLHLAQQDTSSLKLGALCLLTLPYTPVIYYGTEVGATHHEPLSNRDAGGDALARQDMVWREDEWNTGLLELFRQLVRLRHEHTALRRGMRRCRHLETERGIYAYDLVHDSGRVTAAFNLSHDRAVIPFRETGEVLLSAGESCHIVNGELGLPPRSGCLVALRS